MPRKRDGAQEDAAHQKVVDWAEKVVEEEWDHLYDKRNAGPPIPKAGPAAEAIVRVVSGAPRGGAVVLLNIPSYLRVGEVSPEIGGYG